MLRPPSLRGSRDLALARRWRRLLHLQVLHRVNPQKHCKVNDEAKRAEQVQRLIDPTVMVVAVIVPADM